MAFTDEELAYFQGKLGTPLDEDDLDERYTRLQSVPAVALEILRIRMANLQKNPLQFTIPGDYSENRTDNAKLLAQVIEDLEEETGDPDADSVLRGVPVHVRWGR
jgi:hypothetical protein